MSSYLDFILLLKIPETSDWCPGLNGDIRTPIQHTPHSLRKRVHPLWKRHDLRDRPLPHILLNAPLPRIQLLQQFIVLPRDKLLLNPPLHMHPVPEGGQNTPQAQIVDVASVDPMHHPREDVARAGDVPERHAQPVTYRDVVLDRVGREVSHKVAPVAEGGGGHAA